MLGHETCGHRSGEGLKETQSPPGLRWAWFPAENGSFVQLGVILGHMPSRETLLEPSTYLPPIELLYLVYGTQVPASARPQIR